MKDPRNTAVGIISPHAGPILRPVLASAILFMLIMGIVYPLVTTAGAQLLFSHQANGSLMERNGHPVGSAILGQSFIRPDYFHGRPSVTSGSDPTDATKTVAQPYNAGLSAASNQGVLSKSLADAISERAKLYREENMLAPDAQVPVDAVTASASGLDPDISVANALLQVARVARARGMAAETVESLVRRQTRGPQIGVLGDPRVNVLELNLALDAASPRPAQ